MLTELCWFCKISHPKKPLLFEGLLKCVKHFIFKKTKYSITRDEKSFTAHLKNREIHVNNFLEFACKNMIGELLLTDTQLGNHHKCFS